MSNTRAAVYGRQSRGKEKSITEQVDVCTADAVEQGWIVTATYRDRTSASRYRRIDREEWALVVEAVKGREFDVLVLWSSSRGDRDLTSWSGLLDACRVSGVLIHITDDERTYDVRRSGDWQSLAQQGIGNAVDSDKLSTSVKRGHAGAARQGRPAHGKCPYGYRRLYDPATGKLDKQEPDPDTAPIVAEIIERAAQSEPISAIVADLNARGVPTPGARAWYRVRVRDVASNVAYVGVRTYNGSQYPGNWPALVDTATFYAAQRVLAEPSRTTTRPGRQKHLLSYLAVCGECEADLCVVRGRYKCIGNGCVTIEQDPTDLLVTEAVLVRLAHPSIYRALRQAGDDADREAVAAWAEVTELTAKLDGWRLSAARGQTTPESLAVIDADLGQQIRTARRRAERAEVPPALRAVLEPGVDVRERWAALTLPAKRAVVRRLIEVLAVSRGVAGSRTFDPTRLDGSRWRGDGSCWGQRREPDTPEPARVL